MSALSPFFGRDSLQLFEDFVSDMNGYFVKPLHGEPLPQRLRMDVHETPEAFIVTAELPGVGKEHVHVSAEGNRLTVSAEVSQQDSGKEGRLLKTERYYGSISRTVQLPAEVKPQGTKAKLENGILTITAEKNTAEKVKRIAVE